MSSAIRYVSRDNIDVKQWDNCIAHAQNGLIYGFTFYLDQMCKQWDALVLDDYKAVMPLTWNRKAGFSYLYQPAFTPSLGIFGNGINEQLVQHFLESIPSNFRLIEISLNRGNEFNLLYEHSFNAIRRKNYILPLQNSYDSLFNNFNENIRRNVKKSVSLGCEVKKQIPIDDIIHLAKEQLNRLTNLTETDYQNFSELFKSLAARELAKTYGIYLNNQLVSSAAFFFSHKRAYYILVGNHANGKTIGASHYLIDRFIADHAGQDLSLDFEGSDINSLAFFYSSFGSTLEYFPSLKINRLPWYVKWLK